MAQEEHVINDRIWRGMVSSAPANASVIGRGRETCAQRGGGVSAGVAAIHGGGRKGVCWHRTGVGPAVGSILSVAVKLLSCGY
jgi:hypothetical protein